MLSTKSILRPALLLLGAGALAGACNKQDEDKKQAPAVSAEPGAPQSEAELNAVLATIDGVEITVREFQDRINKQSPYIRARYTSNEQKKEFLDNLIRFEVLALEAKQQGFDKDADVVRTMKQVMIQKLMQDRSEKGLRPEDLSEEEMRAHYEASSAEFHKPEEVRVSAIIVNKKALAESTAKAALGEKGSTNKGFRELVALHSTDADTKVRGGDLRYFTATNTSLPKPVVEAAFQLKKTGDVAGPIEAGDGNFYIIKQTGHRKAIDKSFEEVKRQVQNRLYREKRTQAQKDYVEDLKKKATIETFDEELGKVQIDTSGATSGGDGHGHGAHGGPPPGHGGMMAPPKPANNEATP
jgi:peptidyl-prolyl cis-trans isomerase C